MDRRRHDMTGMLLAKLHNPFAEVGISNFDTLLLKMRIEPAFLGKHRLALHDPCYAVLLQNAGNYRVVLGGVAPPMDLCTESCGARFELLKIFVEPRHRVEFDPRGKVAQC